jgi:hypothetical protein
MNIMDGMDAARFTSGNPDVPAASQGKGKNKKQDRSKTDGMPQVLRNLNNQ